MTMDDANDDTDASRSNVVLYGFKYSVYAWMARFALAEKGVAYRWEEVNPFAEGVPASYLSLHPFNRVPALTHGSFALYETSAITCYIDEAFPGVSLQAESIEARARTQQIISIADNYAYWPLVRQVFAHAVLGPRLPRPVDANETAAGFKAAPRVLKALEDLAIGDGQLVTNGPTRADIHLAPIIANFAMAPEGSELLGRHGKLQAWFTRISLRDAFLVSQPKLPDAAR